MEIKKQLITPAKAVELLQSNVKNRNPKTPVVMKYAKDMASGKWKHDTFELIKISKSGIILDGQHRLMAVVKSNTPTFFHIVDGLEDSIFDVLDTGSIRNASDVFKINEVKYSALIPASIGVYDILKSSRQGVTSQVNQRKTNADFLQEYNLNPRYWDSIATESHNLYVQFGRILTNSFICGFMAFFDGINKEDSREFMNQLCTGKNVENDTINLLRIKLVNDKVSIHKMNPTIKQGLIIKTWNAYRKNNELKYIRYAPSTDLFPKAI